MTCFCAANTTHLIHLTYSFASPNPTHQSKTRTGSRYIAFNRSACAHTLPLPFEMDAVEWMVCMYVRIESGLAFFDLGIYTERMTNQFSFLITRINGDERFSRAGYVAPQLALLSDPTRCQSLLRNREKGRVKKGNCAISAAFVARKKNCVFTRKNKISCMNFSDRFCC